MGRKKLEPTVVISERVKARFANEIKIKIKDLIKKYCKEHDNKKNNYESRRHNKTGI